MKGLIISLTMVLVSGCTINYITIPSGNNNTVTMTIDKYQDKALSLTPITSVSSGAASATGSGGNVK